LKSKLYDVVWYMYLIHMNFLIHIMYVEVSNSLRMSLCLVEFCFSFFEKWFLSVTNYTTGNPISWNKDYAKC
jgi:hypothetical protein